jgi:CspA family cold shock protein
MGRYKSYREPRRRGFDDDNFSPRDRDRSPGPSQPPRESTSSSPSTDATVAWFNPDKGFGFVKTSEGGEAFLHIRPLEAAGHSSVPAGARLKVRIGQGQKGPQVTEVLEVDLTTAEPSRPARSPRPQSREGGPEMEGEGSVKWYNAEKGFGFVGIDGGGKDVFVHASVVASSGLTSLSEGEKLTVKYVAGNKGPQATSIRLKD